MSGRVLVPWEHNRKNAPESLLVDVYPGGAWPGGFPADVELYVVPPVPPPDEADQRFDVLTRLPGLKVLQVLTAGFEHVLPHVPSGVVLCNGRGVHDTATAEHALGLILAAQRELPQRWEDQARRRWMPGTTRSLADARVLMVGYGGVGTAIERRLSAFEAKVTRVARGARPEAGVHGVRKLKELLPSADIVVLATPHTPETVGLIGAAELDLLPDDALLVNVGRGSAVDTAALLAQEGRVRAALDVVDTEPLPPEHDLWDAPGVMVTPHVAGRSTAFRPRATAFVDEQLRRWAAGNPLRNVVVRD